MNHVFISYQHESAEYAAKVRAFADSLKADGLLVAFDQLYLEDEPGGPDGGWASWYIENAKKSACVLIVCSKGWFEAALENNRPLYVLGGFGGAAEVLAQAMLGTDHLRPEILTAAWHQEKTPYVAKLATLAGQFAIPPSVRATPAALDALFALVQQARANLAGTLKTGLGDPETRELLMTRDVARVVQLVRKGLESQVGLQALPA